MSGKPSLEELQEKIRRLEGEAEERGRALREALAGELRLRTLIDMAVDGILQGSAEGVITDANTSAQQIFGVRREELIGRHISGLFPSRSLAAQPLRFDLLAQGRIVVTEREVERPDGERVFVEMHSRRMPDGSYHSIVRDISGRKKAEALLEESIARRMREQEFSQLLLDTTPAFIVAIGFDGRTRMMNRALLDALGYAPAEVRGADYLETFVPPEDRRELRAVFDRLIREGSSTVNENRIVSRSGQSRLVEWQGRTVVEEGKNAGFFVGVGIDITRRKEAETELRHREYVLKRIFDVLPIGLWFADRDGTLLRGNPAGVRIWGAEPTVPVNGYGIFKARRLPSGEEVGADEWALVRTIREGVTIKDELLEIDAFDGRKRIIYNYTTPILDDGGNVLGAIVVNNDVTEQKRAEAEREKLKEQLVQAQKMESIGRLAGGVAHDFNNMLGVILGHAEMAMNAVEPGGELHSGLLEIRRAAERSADLTRQLLAFARRQTINPRVLDLNETVEGMLKMLRRLIGEEIELSWLPGTGLWPVRMDASQIHQILANLCVNARDAIAGVGSIRIETSTVTLDEADCIGSADCVPGDYVLLAVRDDGCGMDGETMAKLFEPFFTTKALGQGTGLGLSTVYGIVTQNRGFVRVESAPGAGTTLCVYLPRYEGSAETAPVEIQARPARPGSGTILVVEDESAILEMCRRMLGRAGYRVLAASTPGEALALAGAHAGEIHLLLTDLVMPEMNGLDLAARLQASHPGLRLLFMSGYTPDAAAHQRGLPPGAHFLQKPFAMNTLAEQVRRALEKSG
jgi:PAS domain S-box-containing protein